MSDTQSFSDKFKRALCTLLFSAITGAPGLALATEVQPFRIGTGGTAGAYFPIGSLIAEALSYRAKGEEDEKAAIDDLLVLAQRSKGSVANVVDIGSNLLESGLAQADVVHWAYEGTGPFDGSTPLAHLRAVATLYFESLHLVAHVDSGIASIADLPGHRVSVDEVGSGTELDVITVLQAYGIANDDLQMVYLKPTDAIDRLRRDELDAFFIVAGYPVSGVSALIEEGKATLIPISGPQIDSLLQESPFFTRDTIPAGAYATTDPVPTLSVAAQWIVNAALDEALIYRITRQLWSTETRKRLLDGHPKGREISISSALRGVSIPLHPGAERYYAEIGLQPPDSPD